MTIALDHVVPWGRNFEEYRAMFALTESDLNKRILGCGDGPASFNLQATERGLQVISCDPVYAFSADEIKQRIDDTYDYMIAEVTKNRDTFVWTVYGTPEGLGEVRMNAMTTFLKDLPKGLAEGRYQVAELPDLPYEDGQFDLALVSHFLFLYSDQFPAEFHLDSVKELVRVAGEVRIFPLLAMDGKQSPHLDPVVEALRAEGYNVEPRRVDFEFQVGGHTLLIIKGGASA